MAATPEACKKARKYNVRQSMEHRERETRTNKQKTVNEPKMKKEKNGTVEEKLSPLCTRATPAEIKFVSLFSQLIFVRRTVV